MNIGVLCPAEIAFRRFMPALNTIEDITFIGVGVCSISEREDVDAESKKDYEYFRKVQFEKASSFVKDYGGKVFESYSDVVSNKDLEAVYIPLPPALHYNWARIALEHGKHVLVEKPSTLSANDTETLIGIAESRKLALHENYMFVFHSQLESIEGIINSGEIGDIRLFRISFGFPRRTVNDFRYSKEAGGGALLDAGGYTMKYAAMLLGKTAKLVQAHSNYLPGFEVDMYGSAVMINENGVTAQLAFGMDNDYKCELEVWGSKGTLYTNRVLTAPVGYAPILRISKNGVVNEVHLEPDDSFRKSILKFMDCISDERIRNENVKEILRQAQYVDDFKSLAGMM